MKDSFIKIYKNIINDDKFIFFIISIVFGLIFSFASMFGDDISGMRVEGGSIADYWLKSVDKYYIWTSRLLVNFVVFIFTDNKNTFIWGAYMGGLYMY